MQNLLLGLYIPYVASLTFQMHLYEGIFTFVHHLASTKRLNFNSWHGMTFNLLGGMIPPVFCSTAVC